MDLAEEMGINDYPCPAGGCLLTDPAFADRLRGLLDEYPDPSMPQITLLKAGRHFFSSDGQRVIIPRDDLENRRLLNLRQAVQALVEAVDHLGPSAGIMSAEPPTETTMREAAALVARYGKGREEPTVDVRVYAPDGSWERSFRSRRPTAPAWPRTSSATSAPPRRRRLVRREVWRRRRTKLA